MRGRIGFAPVAVFIAVLAILAAGCSLTPDRIAFNSLQTVKATAESSLRVAASLYNANEIREDQWNDVVLAYNRVQAACKVAASGLALVKTDAQAAVIVADAQRLLVQLQSLVASFTPKPVAWLAPSHGGAPCLA